MMWLQSERKGHLYFSLWPFLAAVSTVKCHVPGVGSFSQFLWQLHFLTLWNIYCIFCRLYFFVCVCTYYTAYSPKCSLYWRWIFCIELFTRPPSGSRIQQTAVTELEPLVDEKPSFQQKIGPSESFSSRLAVYETHAAFCRNQMQGFPRCNVKVKIPLMNCAQRTKSWGWI